MVTEELGEFFYSGDYGPEMIKLLRVVLDGERIPYQGYFNNKLIWVNKSGIGSKIFMFAHQNSILYGIGTIIFAIIIGVSAAVIFRKL